MTDNQRGALWSALRFAASRSAITAADEKSILATWDSRAQPTLTFDEAVEIIFERLKGWPRVSCKHPTVNRPNEHFSTDLEEVLGAELLRETAQHAAKALRDRGALNVKENV